jgi:hypothetical protein
MIKKKKIKTVRRAGKECKFVVPAYPIEEAVPTIEQLVVNRENDFISVYPGNHPGLTWITTQKVNQDNHLAYVYAFAVYAITEYNPSNHTSWQFRKNLSRVMRKLETKKISKLEKEVLLFMKYDMDSLFKYDRITKLMDYTKKLEEKAKIM